MSAQVKVSRRKGFRHRRQRGIPLITGIRPEAVAPGGVSGRRATLIGSGVDTDRYGMRMETQSPGRIFEEFSKPERTCWRHRQRRTATDKGIALVPGDADILLKQRIIRLEVLISHRPIGELATRRKYLPP